MFKLILKHFVFMSIGIFLIFLLSYFQKDAGDIIFIMLSFFYAFCYFCCIIVIYRRDLKKIFLTSILLCLFLLIIGIVFIYINYLKEKNEEIKMIKESTNFW